MAPTSPIAPAPTVQTAAAVAGLTLGCIGVLMLGVQPLVLGALLDEHRLSVAQLTQAAMLEQLALGIVAGALGAFAARRHLRLYGCAGCLLVAAANAACLGADGMGFVLWRGVSGLGGGILLWIAAGVVAFSPAPARLSALFVAAQAALQGLLAALLPITLIPILGANSGLASLGALSVISILLVRLLPAELPDLAKQEFAPRHLGVGAYAGLIASFFFMAAIVGVWVFVEPLATSSNINPSVARFAVASNLTAQFLAAVLMSILAKRLATVAGWVLVGCCAILLLAIALLFDNPHNGTFLAAVLLHGFAWSVGLTFYVPLLIRADPTRRAAVLLGGAQMLGGSAGPIITGAFATETHLMPVLFGAALLTSIALVNTLVSSLHPSRSQWLQEPV